jgi:hypothetical protein
VRPRRPADTAAAIRVSAWETCDDQLSQYFRGTDAARQIAADVWPRPTNSRRRPANPNPETNAAEDLIVGGKCHCPQPGELICRGIEQIAIMVNRPRA